MVPLLAVGASGGTLALVVGPPHQEVAVGFRYHNLFKKLVCMKKQHQVSKSMRILKIRISDLDLQWKTVSYIFMLIHLYYSLLYQG